MKYDRRDFLSASLAAGTTCLFPADCFSANLARRPRIAAIITEYRPLSHADVIVTRFIQGHVLGTDTTYGARTQIASMYVDQFPKGDLSRPVGNQYGIPIKDSIESALTLDTDQLAVDGVLIIGEHGNYPHNEKGQHMYPRRRMFEEVVATFEKTGEAVPVFNDKHLGFAWKDAKWMYDKSRELEFPLMAGSSLPTTWRRPDLELPNGVELDEALAIGYGGLEAYGFHALETLQCMIEHRKGGETGVRSVRCLEGDDVWKVAERGEWSRELLTAALDSVDNKLVGSPEKNCKNPAVYLIEHVDGLRSSIVMLSGYNNAFAFACRRKNGKVDATHFWLQEPRYGHFSYLTHNIETMFLTGKETYPPERTLMTTGVLDAVMTSRFKNHVKIETPELKELVYRNTSTNIRRAKTDD